MSSENAVKATFVNCVKKASISSSNQQVTKTDADDSFKCLVEELNSLRALDLNAVEEDLSAESFIVLDDDAVLSGTILSDAIIFDISNDDDNNVGEDDGNSGDDMNETPLLRPSNIAVGETLNKFHNLSVFRNLR